MNKLSREEILSKYIDHYRLTFEKREDLNKTYEDHIEYKYEDDSNIIEDTEYWNYYKCVCEPKSVRVHPFMFKIELIPKCCYVVVIPEIPMTKMWLNGDLPKKYTNPPNFDKVRLEPVMLILGETNQTTFMKIEPETIIKKVGNVIIKKIRHRHVIDFYKIFEYMNYEFRFSKFELTEYGFNRLCTNGEIDLSDKEYIIRMER